MIGLHNADCLETLPTLPEASVDLVLTDPPYGIGQFAKRRGANFGTIRKNNFADAGWDDATRAEWRNLMAGCFTRLARVVRPGGSVVMFMAKEKMGELVELALSSGFYYKTIGVWHKTNPIPRNWELQFVGSNEAWLYLTYKQKTGTFNNSGRLVPVFIETTCPAPSERKCGEHPTQKPERLMAWFVELLSNPGDVVLDPFMGSGTAGVCAKRAGRSFIGVEKDPGYFAIAEKRNENTVEQTRLFA